MKRKETALGGSAEEGTVLEWSIDEDMPAKKHGVKRRVFSVDTNTSSSSGLRGPCDKV
jgi:hypothetical protein